MSDNQLPTYAPERRPEYSPAQIAVIRRTVASDCNDAEFSLFAEVCKRTGLDPFRKQIYAVVYNKNKADKRKMSIITGIDGYRSIAARSGDYRPAEDEAEIFFSDDLVDKETNPLGIEYAKATVWKMDKRGNWHPIRDVAYWHEYAPLKAIWKYSEAEGRKVPSGEFTLDKTGKWYTMPRLMIGKCAEAKAIRKGWPEDLSGIHTPEEMDQARAEETASEVVERFEREERLKAIGGGSSIPFILKYGGDLQMIDEGVVYDRVLETIGGFDHLHDLLGFMESNREGLRQFWAVDKSAALDLKEKIEARKAELEKGEAGE